LTSTQSTPEEKVEPTAEARGINDYEIARGFAWKWHHSRQGFSHLCNSNLAWLAVLLYYATRK